MNRFVYFVLFLWDEVVHFWECLPFNIRRAAEKKYGPREMWGASTYHVHFPPLHSASPSLPIAETEHEEDLSRSEVANTVEV